jgi:hypothetical protein
MRQAVAMTRSEELEVQWMQVKSVILGEYARAGIHFWPINPPDELPDLAKPGTFEVSGRIARGDYEDDIRIECTSGGDGRFTFPVKEPTTLRAAIVERERRRQEAEERDRRFEELTRLTPAEQADVERRARGRAHRRSGTPGR